MNAADRLSDAWQWMSTWSPRASAVATAALTASKYCFASPEQRFASGTSGSRHALVVGLPWSNAFRSSGSSSRGTSMTSTSGPQNPVRASHWQSALLTTSLMGAPLVAALSFSLLSMSW